MVTMWEIIWFVLRLIFEGMSKENAIAEASARFGVERQVIERHLD